MVVEKTKVKEKLECINDIRKQISRIEFKLKKLEEKDTEIATVEASYKRPPYSKHNVVVQAQTIRTKELISRYKSILQERYNDLLEVQTEIEEFINTLPNARLQMIFEYRYIDKYTWSKIAYILGGNSTEDSVRKEHDRFLNEN